MVTLKIRLCAHRENQERRSHLTRMGMNSNIRMDIRGCIGKQQDQAGKVLMAVPRLVMILKLLMVEI